MAEQAVPVEAESYAGGMDATTAKRVKITVRGDSTVLTSDPQDLRHLDSTLDVRAV